MACDSVAPSQLPVSIGDVLYFTTYNAAVPVRLSSPGMVQERTTLRAVVSIAVRLATAAGGMLSRFGVKVVTLGQFETTDQLPVSSTVLIANEYAVAGSRPVTIKDSFDPAVFGFGSPES